MTWRLTQHSMRLVSLDCKRDSKSMCVTHANLNSTGCHPTSQLFSKMPASLHVFVKLYVIGPGKVH